MPATLTFATTDWADEQTVTVTGAHDDNISNESLTVNLTAASTDSDYDTMTASVSVAVTDDDRSGLVVSDTEVSVTEGGTDTFTVSLAARPRGAVTIRAASANTTKATVEPNAVNVPSYRWNQPQTFTITGVDDTNSSDETVEITVTVTGSGWASVTPVPVAVTVTDDDAVTELTVTCDTTAETITIAWPEDGAIEVYLEGQTSSHPYGQTWKAPASKPQPTR